LALVLADNSDKYLSWAAIAAQDKEKLEVGLKGIDFFMMKNKLAKFFKKYGLVLVLLLLAGWVIFPTGVLALDPPPTAPITSVSGIVNLAGTILTWMARIFWIAAIMAVFYAGFLYLGSSADPERVKKAKTQLLYAVVAMAIGLMAWGLPALVENFLSGDSGGTPGGGGTPYGDYNVLGDING
jgi:hypothetical protein